MAGGWPPRHRGVAFEPPFRFCQKRMLIQIGLYSLMNEGLTIEPLFRFYQKQINQMESYQKPYSLQQHYFG